MTFTTHQNTSTPPTGNIWKRAIRLHRVTWWVWACIATLLGAGLFGVPWAREAAFGVAAAQAAFYSIHYRSLGHFPTQLRVVYLAWMAASFAPGLIFMFWIQTAGTIALTLTGYCPLARMLMLLPSNRSVPLTLKRVGRIVFHPPTQGSVLAEIKL